MEKQVRDQLLVNAMDEYGYYLFRLAYAFVKDKEKAEDIIQEVFIRYYLHLEQFEGRSSIKTYLYRMTVNECRNYFKSWNYRKTELSHIASIFLVNKQTPEEEYLKQESIGYMIELLNKLPQKYKEVLWLHYYAELTVVEIGEVLNCSTNTIKTRLARGRKKARFTLSEEEMEHVKER
ncbi:MAG: sigma-70 family RNA polymerase sigma factor [Bacillus sp. (in: firmicutes)]